jgi:ribonuclease D
MDPIKTEGTVPQSPQFTWVAAPEPFRRMLETLMPASRVAIDIEADSLYHYFEKVCLVQISIEEETYIVDPLVVRDLSALGPIMADPSVEKVFHAATYDLYCLRRDYGFSFANIFDTHIAAQLLGCNLLGLDALLESFLGITHSKRRQRDDWSHRPLAREQLEYAAMDTRHLLQLRDLLDRHLRDQGRISWAQEEFRFMAELESGERDFDPEDFRRIKGSRGIPLQQLAVLRALYLLRDGYAREMDIPPFKVVNNSVLLELACHPPGSPREMFKRPGISFRVARRFGGEIYRTIKRAQSADPSFLAQPARSTAKPPSREARTRLEDLRLWRRARAEELQLPVGVVFPGALLELLASFPPPDLSALRDMAGMRRWRAQQFGEEILHILSKDKR